MTMPNAGKNMEKMENSYIDGENVSSTATLEESLVVYTYHMIQQSHSLLFTQRNLKLISTQTPTHRCL